MKATGKPWSRCLDQLWRAVKRTGSSNINFVPTHHWLPPPGRSGIAAGVGQYCTMDGTDGSPRCIGWTPALVNEFRDSLAVCFAEAFRMGLTVSVRPHLVRAPGRCFSLSPLWFVLCVRVCVPACLWFWALARSPPPFPPAPRPCS